MTVIVISNPGSGGGGVVNSVTAGDASITVGGTAANPTVEAGTLDQIATLHPPAAAVALNGQKITGLANGSGAQDAAAYGQIPTSAGSIGGLLATNNLSDLASKSTAFASIAPLTTEGDLLYENATPAPARLQIGAAGTSLQSNGTLPSWGPALVLQATTGATGHTLVNGTGTIISWTPPDDGQLHRVMIIAGIDVTSDETGGTVYTNITLPDGTNSFVTLFNGDQDTGFQVCYNGPTIYVQKAGVQVEVAQYSPLTGGAATLWAEIWGS